MAQVRLDDEITSEIDRYRGDEESRAAFVNAVLRDVFAVWEQPVRQKRASIVSRRVRPQPRRF